MPNNIPDSEIQWDDEQQSVAMPVSSAIDIPDHAIQWDDQKPKPKLKLPEYSRGLGRSILQGALLGWGDEAAAGVATAIAAGKQIIDKKEIPSGEDVGGIYRDIKGSEALNQAQFVDENPKTALAAEIGGGVVTAGLTGGGAMGSAGTIGQVAKQGAIQGGKIGAIYGAGTSEGGNSLTESAANTAKGAVTGGITGAATGGAITPALVGVGRGIKAISANIADRYFKSNAEKAATYVQQLAKETGFTPDEIATRYEQLGPQATLADLSENLLSGAKTAVDQIGPTKEAARALVGNRQKGQFGETIKILSRQLGGVSGDDAAIALEKNARERAAQAGPLYEQALKSNVPQTEELKKLQALPVFKEAYAKAGEYAANDLSRVARNPDPNLIGSSFSAGKLSEAEKLHYAKMALYDMESAQARAGNTNAAKNIGDARKALTNNVLDSLPNYKQARGIWSGSMEQDEALNVGRELFKMPAREFKQSVSAMNDQEKNMARLGLMDAAEERLGARSDNLSTASYLIKDPNTRSKLEMLLDADQMKALEENAKKWDSFTRTKNVISGGSRTAENMTVEQESAKMQAAAGSPIDQMKNKLFESLTNPNRLTKENAEEVGKILLKQGMNRQEVLDAVTIAQKDPTRLRQLMSAGQNALLVDQVPLGGAAASAAFPTYGKIGLDAEGNPRYGRIR